MIEKAKLKALISYYLLTEDGLDYMPIITTVDLPQPINPNEELLDPKGSRVIGALGMTVPRTPHSGFHYVNRVIIDRAWGQEITYSRHSLPERHRLVELILPNNTIIQAVLIFEDREEYFVPVSSLASNLEGFNYKGWLGPVSSCLTITAWRYI